MNFTVEISTTMPIEPGVVDANVLVYALNEEAPHHNASRELLEAASDSTTTLYLTSQILCEFYSVITNPRRVAIAVSPAEALSIISDILDLPGVRVLPTPARAVAGWMSLVRRNPVVGANIFDLQIVATMLANRIPRIYTFNGDDFSVFAELRIVTP